MSSSRKENYAKIVKNGEDYTIEGSGESIIEAVAAALLGLEENTGIGLPGLLVKIAKCLASRELRKPNGEPLRGCGECDTCKARAGVEGSTIQ